MVSQMNRYFVLFYFGLSLFACSSEPGSDEHAPPAPSSREVTNVDRIVEPLTNCTPPFQVTRRLSNVVAKSAIPNATCPMAWFSNYDPMSWKQGMPFFDDQDAMSVPAGTCQQTRRIWSPVSCAQSERWACPNGVTYNMVMRAVTSDWRTTRLTFDATDNDGSCTRTGIGDFNQ